MKLGILMAALACAACSYRTPEMYRDDTRAALESKNAEIQRCYDDVLETTPNAQGKVDVTFEVETEHGQLTHVAVAPSTTAPPALAACVTKSIHGVALASPDPRKGVGSWSYDFAIAH